MKGGNAQEHEDTKRREHRERRLEAADNREKNGRGERRRESENEYGLTRV